MSTAQEEGFRGAQGPHLVVGRPARLLNRRAIGNLLHVALDLMAIPRGSSAAACGARAIACPAARGPRPVELRLRGGEVGVARLLERAGPARAGVARHAMRRAGAALVLPSTSRSS